MSKEKKAEKNEQTLTVKEKIKVWADKEKAKAKAFFKYLDENPEKVGMLIGGIGATVLTLFGLEQAKLEKAEQACHIQDDRLGSYWKTTHPLTNDELMEVNNRMLEMQYDDIGQALQELGYLEKERRRR